MQKIVQLLGKSVKLKKREKWYDFSCQGWGDCTNTKKATREYRLSQWTQVIQARLDSGQSVKDFCQAKGISKDAYYYWQHELREVAAENLEKAEESKGRVPNGWMQLTPSRAKSTSLTIDIEINGCCIKVSSETDSELLKKVCLTLISL